MSLARVPAKMPIAKAIFAKPAPAAEDGAETTPEPAPPPAPTREAKATPDVPVAAQALLTPKQAAALLGVGIGLLRQWRAAGKGPRCVTLSDRITRYRVEDVERFVAARSVGGE